MSGVKPLYRLAKGRRPLGDSVQELLGLSRDTLEREARAGRLIVTRIGWRIYVRPENLEAWLRSCDEPLPKKTPTSRVSRRARIAEHRMIRDRFLAGRRP